MQGAVLSILHCLLHYVDFNLSANAQQVNADLLRVIAKYIEVVEFFISFFSYSSSKKNNNLKGRPLERSFENSQVGCDSVFFTCCATFVF